MLFRSHNSFTWQGTSYPAVLLCDLLHTEGAEALCTYEHDFYAGMPVLTRNHFGQGYAYYVATRSNAEFYHRFVGDLCTESGITPILHTSEPIEVTERTNDNGAVLVLLNHGTQSHTVTLNRSGVDLFTDREYQTGDKLILAAKDVAIIRTTL